MAAVGVYMLKGPFWALATEQLPPVKAAASIAAINAVGNLGGFLGPYLIGAIKDGTGSFGPEPRAADPVRADLGGPVAAARRRPFGDARAGAGGLRLRLRLTAEAEAASPTVVEDGTGGGCPSENWRKRMGIEPTVRCWRTAGFEDQEGHQTPFASGIGGTRPTRRGQGSGVAFDPAARVAAPDV